MPEIGLSFTRFYSSSKVYSDDFIQTQSVGGQWRTNYSASLVVLADSTTDPNSSLPNPVVKARRANGQLLTFNKIAGQWVSDADIHISLSETAVGYAMVLLDGVTEEYDLYSNGKARLVSIAKPDGKSQLLTYNASNQLELVTGPYGHLLQFTYVGGFLKTMNDPAGQVYTYTYGANGNLEYVYYPDGSSDTYTNNPYRRYHYEKPATPVALTGISDWVNNLEVRYATFDYDSQGRAITSYHTGNTQRVDVSYNDVNGARTVTNSKGTASTYSTTSQLGIELVTNVSGPGCSTCGNGDESSYYDPVTNNLMYVEESVSRTKYGQYDSNGNYHCKVEGVSLIDGTNLTLDQCAFDANASPDARSIYYTYNSSFPGRIETITEASLNAGTSKITTYTYDTFGNRRSEQVAGYSPDGAGGWTSISRTSTFKYGGPNPSDCPEADAPFNQLCEIDGPRTDVSDITQYRYWPFDTQAQTHGPNDGRLKEVEEATGVLLRHNLQYTATGKVASEDRPNGLSLSYTYYPGNDRLETLTESDGATSQVTRWTWLATGEVQSITTADGSPDATTLTFTYDAARRLERITDGLGNYIHYTLDTEGNVIEEMTFDATDSLKRQLTQSFDSYNRLDTTAQANEASRPGFCPGRYVGQINRR